MGRNDTSNYIISAVLLLLLFISGCRSGSSEETMEVPENGTHLSPVSSVVSTGIAEIKPFQYLIQGNGKVKSRSEQLIIADFNGKLQVCLAQTGRQFRQGAVIARFETTPIQHKLERGRLALFNTSREYESQLLGYEQLLKDKTKEQSDDIRMKLKISSGMAIAEQDIKEANYELSRSFIRAPFSGILADVKIQKGQYLRQGQELFRIYDPYNLVLEIKILESDIGMLKPGTPAIISPLSGTGHRYTAAVAEINPYVDDGGMVTVKLNITNPPINGGNRPLLFPGMNCVAEIKVPLADALIVPRSAIVMRSGKAVVFSMENNRAKWNYVTTGRDNGAFIEITEGLKAGQKIIISNNLQLANDAPVKEDNSAADIN